MSKIGHSPPLPRRGGHAPGAAVPLSKKVPCPKVSRKFGDLQGVFVAMAHNLIKLIALHETKNAD
jgi:hypothetical protein